MCTEQAIQEFYANGGHIVILPPHEKGNRTFNNTIKLKDSFQSNGKRWPYVERNY